MIWLIILKVNTGQLYIKGKKKKLLVNPMIIACADLAWMGEMCKALSMLTGMEFWFNSLD